MTWRRLDELLEDGSVLPWGASIEGLEKELWRCWRLSVIICVKEFRSIECAIIGTRATALSREIERRRSFMIARSVGR